MTNMAQDFDPLSYGCAVYDQLMNCQETGIPPAFPNGTHLINNLNMLDMSRVTNPAEDSTLANLGISEDVKPDIKKRKVDGRTKNMSLKITQKDFKFYGCSVCNVCYPTLAELDYHVTSHKDRITSYDLRVKNQLKKKKLKKEMKKHKKLKNSVKKENEFLDIEIKPEDGYIGTERVSDLNDLKENKEELDEKNLIIPAPKNVSLSEMIAKKQELLNLQKIYKCFACQKQFTLSYYLKLHVRSHTDEKPYTCAECGQSFITASKLGRHNKRFHLAIRYQCRICYQFFSRFEFLTRHFDKKHPDDKLEGEPYDYNAILPYLKELEEQLKEKEEQNKKDKPTDVWGDMWPVGPEQSDDRSEPKQEDVKDVDIKKEIDVTVPILIEEVKVDPIDNIEIKLEVEDTYKEELDNNDDDVVDDKDNDVSNNDTEEKKKEDQSDSDVKNEAASDDEYFPSNTWAVTPKEEVPKPAPSRQCPVCHKHVSSASYLRVHMRTHSGERPHRCPRCPQAFITASKMHRHALTHPEVWTDDIKSEMKSEKDEDDEDKKSRMKKALAKFSKKAKKGEKKKKSYQRRPHACDFCQKRFLHAETLQIHQKSHEGEPLVLRCSFCLLELADAAARAEHEAEHTGPRPYLCTICGKTYTKRETMVYHRKSHSAQRSYICDVCTKSFGAAGKLARHLAAHRAPRYVLRYECPVCAHMFNTKYHVQMHLATHQREGLIQEENRNEILAMVLQNARKIPKQPDAPASLTAAASTDERSRVCNICGEVFQHFYYLEEHLKSHGSRIAVEDSERPEDKKHVCPVCSKGFKLHYYLKLHSFTHTKEKPFICQQCGKGFITRGKLKRHLETHSGLKKYQCHICNKFFTRPSYLRIHVRTIHGTQDYNFRFDLYRSEAYGASSVVSDG